MKEFVLLFRHPNFAGLSKSSPQEMQALQKKWMDWTAPIKEQGNLSNAGMRLALDGKVLRTNGVVTDGPFAEIKEILGSFIVIKAENIDDAVTFAHGCPILDGGGSVEIRPSLSIKFTPTRPAKQVLFLSMEDKNESLKRLFQEQFTKMVAVISKLYGLEHIEIAEDIVSETFLLAAETWGVKGIPPNPDAWLYSVAKQKTLYHFRRNKILNEKIIPQLKSELQEFEEMNFSPENIKDSQLQMMFAVCNPAIASEAQIGLALRILCGFGIDEIAEAFLSNKETINKRLFRAKEKLRQEKIKMEIPEKAQLSQRLDNVLHIIYLLFNEGYYSKTQNKILQKDLCLEAMRMGVMLTENDETNLPKTNALLALMCFHASRFAARETDENGLVLYEKQNEELWDKELIANGMNFLNRSAQGSEISSYHIEARIAYLHSIKDAPTEKWSEILGLYDRLLLVNYSPSVALNRIFALYKVAGPKTAIKEVEKFELRNDHFYFVLLGELYKAIDPLKASQNFQKAYSLAKTDSEKRAIQLKIDSLQ